MEHTLNIHDLRKQCRLVWNWQNCISCENFTTGSLKFAPHVHHVEHPRCNQVTVTITCEDFFLLPSILQCFTQVLWPRNRLGTHSDFGSSSRFIQVGSRPLTSAGSASLALVPAPAAQSPHDNGSRDDVHSRCLYHCCRSHGSGGCCINWRSCECCRPAVKGEELGKNSMICSLKRKVHLSSPK